MGNPRWHWPHWLQCWQPQPTGRQAKERDMSDGRQTEGRCQCVGDCIMNPLGQAGPRSSSKAREASYNSAASPIEGGTSWCASIATAASRP
eukprot:347883-Pelagomonas_calceolata.AAC.1